MPTKLELYERVTPLAGLGIWERNLVTGEAYWNQIIREIFEIEAAETPAMDEVIMFYKDPARIRAILDEAMRSGQPHTGTFEISTASNEQKWIRLRVQSQIAGGACERIYGTIEDITDNVRLLNELQEKEKRFSEAFDHAPIGMALVSPEGHWIKVNESLCQLLGYNEQEFMNHTFQEFTYPKDLDSDLRQMTLLLNGKIQRYSMEKRYYRANGVLIWALLSVSLVRDAAGNPLYFVSQVKDITQRKRNMETIRDQNARLLNFAHIISHNLRSHTGNIRMMTSMISEEQDEEERIKLVEMLDINANNLLETLNHLNEVVKIHDKGQADVAELHLRQQVERVMEILGPSFRAARAKVDLQIDPALVINYSPAYLESILINLLTNCLKYKHPERKPEISICAELADSFIQLSISDNGLGIDLELHGHKLFGMYKTFHKHEDARGMGLFLVKNHVEAMGGRIHAESKPGEGTKFTMEINTHTYTHE
ncbi:sensor histidine kinase [Pedobacter faecalis]|uniref:sensor histidine kinase n=1 Tax=Pedobacter faecalis TaxID=3041495 RepID=UPI00254B7713|nr:sensor histidine kinase [Pedobacter sp. ELA7]